VIFITTCTGASQTGKRAGVVLDQDADEALQAPTIARCSMTGWRLALVRDVLGAQALGIMRSRPASCRTATAAHGVLQRVFDLRAVEGAVARAR
jgi:hypothetical protein